jgi:hypothetical protein
MSQSACITGAAKLSMACGVIVTVQRGTEYV